MQGDLRNAEKTSQNVTKQILLQRRAASVQGVFIIPSLALPNTETVTSWLRALELLQPTVLVLLYPAWLSYSMRAFKIKTLILHRLNSPAVFHNVSMSFRTAKRPSLKFFVTGPSVVLEAAVLLC